MDYLTEEDYQIAEKNGISRNRAYARYYVNCWSKKRAITQPLFKKSPEFRTHAKIAQANGINITTFYSRVQRGLPLSDASSLPTGHRRPIAKKITDEQLAIAAANGIKPTTVWNRVKNLFWPIEKAITKPVNHKFNWRSTHTN